MQTHTRAFRSPIQRFENIRAPIQSRKCFADVFVRFCAVSRFAVARASGRRRLVAQETVRIISYHCLDVQEARDCDGRGELNAKTRQTPKRERKPCIDSTSRPRTGEPPSVAQKRLQTRALTRTDLHHGELGRAGFEPATHGFSIRTQDGVTIESATGYESDDGCLADQLADGGAAGGEIDADLARIIDAWPVLSADVRKQIVTMIDDSTRAND